MQQLSETGKRVFNARLATRDVHGTPIETFEEAVIRISNTAASAEKSHQNYWAQNFAASIGSLLFIPSTPIWANIGKVDRPWQPSACFVLAVEDSLDSMYKTLADTAMVFKSGGGVGYNFSTIRPKGSLVHSTKGRASGVVELIKLYNASSDMVMQGGVRRGASMGILNVNHPEIIDFLNAKRDGGLTNFNLSVGITDAFMSAVEQDQDWPLIFNGQVYDTIPAVTLWSLIINAAHACGDPGLIFLDAAAKDNPLPKNLLNSCNPCAEQFLTPGESCLLGSVNLARMVRDDGQINEPLLKETVTLAVRFLDNLIDIAEYPLPEISAATRSTRKIGLGFTGLADALIMANLAYDSEAGRAYAGTITAMIQQAAIQTSCDLGAEKGCFPDWENSIYFPAELRRNAACVTIAPTGSVTTMAGCEGYGVEPLFAVAYRKATNVAGDFDVFSPLFLSMCKKYNIADHILFEVAERGTCQNVVGIPTDLARIFKGAQEISAKDHVLMQAAVQSHVCNAVSKTINLPTTATAEDIANCYKFAHKLGLKGITVFRDGCKEGTISIGSHPQSPSLSAPVFARGEVRPRPQCAQGITHRLDTGCGKLYLTINHDNGAMLETFITTGSDGGCLVYTETTSRLISLALRGGISAQTIIEQLQGTHPCPSYLLARGKGKDLSPGKSCASAIAHRIQQTLEEINTQTLAGPPCGSSSGVCECGSALEFAEGCMVCRSCGFSKC